ncbi:signal peptidase II Aspartic peptidase. MEROPS family A08 [Fodinibius roseus]|uniref:Lipoprotein signal peptidase n=1 Tax=Fodinibius roseus TaxID=1194090 RepID=A0A1M4ZMY2_9BACT|nr:signal peptidase II [Fodinibius roseus]SHF19368.1 signal peptidase II Aspartic peptidase. MEROPS family A08 [Fodinibius roseus]
MNSQKITTLTVPIVVVVLLDQLTKHWIRLSPEWQNWEVIPGWLAFHYTQNPGMALGMRWASTEIISVIAIIATLGILGYVVYNRNSANKGYLFCMGLILGGAIGNIIDRLVMGYIGQYGGVLEGHVVDFIHFNLEVGGYAVFPYIFNVADIAISVAIVTMLVFHNRIMPVEEESLSASEKEKLKETSPAADMEKFSQSGPG